MAKKRQTTGLPKIAPKSTATNPAVKSAQGAGGGSGSKLDPRYSIAILRKDASHHSHAEREAAVQQLVILGVVVVAVVVAILLIGAVIIEGLYRPNQAVAKVNGENVTVAQFQQRVKIEHAVLGIRFSNILGQYAMLTGGDVDTAFQQLSQQDPYRTWYSELTIADTLANRVLNDMVDDKIIEKAAADLGVTVTDADVEEQINNFIGYDPEEVAKIGVEPTVTPTQTISPTPFVSPTPSQVPTATFTPTPSATWTPVPEGSPTADTSALTVTPVPTEVTPTLSVTEVQGEFQTRRDELFTRLRSESGVGDAELMTYFRSLALRSAVAKKISVQGTTVPYVNSRHILVATEEEAQDVIAALLAGESFADLARAVSTDTGSGANGGELGWSPVSNYVTEFADAVENGVIGEILGPVKSDFGYHIIQVRAREDREVEESELNSVRERDFATWLEAQRTAEGVTYETYSSWTDNVPNVPTFAYSPF